MACSSQYIGRFAPSPTGHLHFGSLVAALGSYLDAKHHQGKWLIRIEDVDSTRCKKSYETSILNTLSYLGLHSDDNIRIQSHQTADYQQALNQLSNDCYRCYCSRKHWQTQAKLGEIGFIYPQLCAPKFLQKKQRETSECLTSQKQSATSHHTNATIRLTLPNETIRFYDQRLGNQTYHYQQQIGDPILQRSNGDIAYALAVCVDDNQQGITHIVRGEDLLATTPIQIFIQKQLDYSTPNYLHLPLAVDERGKKLSKQNHAKPITQTINSLACYQLITEALILLKQVPPKKTYRDYASLIHFAIEHWKVPPSA